MRLSVVIMESACEYVDVLRVCFIYQPVPAVYPAAPVSAQVSYEMPPAHSTIQGGIYRYCSRHRLDFRRSEAPNTRAATRADGLSIFLHFLVAILFQL